MRLPRSLQWRIALTYTALIIIAMGVVSFYLVNFVRDSYVSDLEQRLEQEAGLVGETAARYFRGPLEPADLQVVSEQMGRLIDARITVIARDGTVLADNWGNPSALENHALRPEVQGALNTGLGRATRISTTTGQELSYTAVPIRVDGTLMGVARVAVPTATILANVNRIITTIIFAALVVASLSITLGYFVARRTTRSVRSVTEGARHLAAGDLEHRVNALAADETQELADAFNRMATSLREMIRDLSSERNKLSAILDTMADGVIVVGPQGRIELMNRAAESLFNVTGQKAVGSRFLEVVRDHDLQRLISHSLETKQQQHGEVELLHRRRFLSAIATPLTGSVFPGVLLTLHDLTRIRQVETTRKEFVSNVSHELRSPLASVKAMVETLEHGGLEERPVAQDFLRRIHQDVDRMNGMVGTLLELSRLESGQDTLHLRPLDLRPLIEAATAELSGLAEAKQITVEVALPGELPLVMGEEDRLRQVLINLLDNAIKFTPQQGKITLSARPEERAVEVRISDSGIGIAAEHLPRIFERFYKVDHSRRGGGTGLGLAIVKHIVQAHGGEVRVESQEGVGSSFIFTVPRAM